MGGPALLILLALFVTSCLGAPTRSSDEQPPRIHRRLLKAAFDDVWSSVAAVLRESGLDVASEDRDTGVVTSTLLRRQPRGPNDPVAKELIRIADIETARRRGMQQIAEYHVEYRITVSRLDEGESTVEVAAEIAAVDRSQALFLGTSILSVPQYFPLRSRGVLEREMIRRVAHRLFVAEEALYFVGELGRD